MTKEELQQIKLPLSSTDYEKLKNWTPTKSNQMKWTDLSPELRKEYNKRSLQALSDKYLTSIND